METPTPFDLNEAIRRWQQNLGASPAFAGDNPEELATHLRASVLTLTAKGLAEEEAFLIALRRLGDPSDLEKEFGKVNAGSVWLTRGIWMLVGIVGLNLVGSLSTATSSAAVLFLHHCLPPDLQLADGAWRGFIGLTAEGLLIVLALKALVTRPKVLTQWFQRRVLPPWLMLFGLVLLAVGLEGLNYAFTLLFVRYVGAHQYGQSAATWSAYARWGLNVTLPPLVLGLLARRRFGQKPIACDAR